VLTGSALQMMQWALWQLPSYLVIVVLALGGLAVLGRRRAAGVTRTGWFLACAALVFSLTGIRASLFDAHRLMPVL
jgi:hypothetical protein